MSNVVATVAFLQGQAWAKAPDGSLRPLSVGSTLNADEILVTAQGAQVQLDFGNGDPVAINGGLEVAMSRDFSAETGTEPNEAALDDASVQEALTVLEQGGDLLEELEETAAGDNSGGGSDGNNSFVQLTRVLEQTDSQVFEYSPLTASATTLYEVGSVYVNRAPLVSDQSLTLNEDEVLRGSVIASDIESDPLTYTLATAPANGDLVLDPQTGQFVFTPNANFNGTDSFVVTVTDSRGNSTNTSITLNIAPVNDVPTTNEINLTTSEDVPANGQVVAQDIENDTLSYVVSGQPASGTVVLDPATGTFVYTPNANYNGGDSFVVTVSDGNGGTTTSLVTIGITSVNDAPVSNDQSLVTDEDTPINGQVVASDVDGDSLGYSVSGQPANGTVSLNPATGAFVYTPNANYNGSDSFVVSISDGNGGTTTSRINIGVTSVNDAPLSSNQSLTASEDTPVSGVVAVSDVDGDTLVYSLGAGPGNGSVSLNPATGSFVYTPNANYNGNDSFTVTISDGNGGTTTSVVNIDVTPVNDGPTAANLDLTTNEDVPLSGQVVASDVDGNTLSFGVSGQPINGTVNLNPATGSFVYTPNANFNGNDSFVVSISDGKGGTTNSRINIGVTSVNDVPVSSDQNLTTPEDVALTGNIVADDIEGDALAYAVSVQPANGTVNLNPATGSFVYTPNANFNGNDSFVVSISDGKGGTTTSRINIGVTSVNDVPVSSDQNLTTPEDVALTGSVVADDIEGDALAYAVSGQPANGSVSLNPATGSFVYTPNANFNGNDSFVVSISDGKGGTTTSRINIGVTAVNDVPASSDQNLSTLEDVPLSGQVVASDVDGNSLSFVVSGQPANGTVALNPQTGSFVYTPNVNYNGNDSFTVTISDGNGGTTTSLVNIGVTPVNDGPTAGNLDLTTDEDVPVNGVIGANDLDGDTLSYSITGNPTQGAVALNPSTGAFTYTPNAGYGGNDSFVVTVSDGKGGVATSTVSVNVNPLNDAPVATDLSLTTVEDTAVNGAISASDPEGNTLSYSVAGNPAKGTVVLNPSTGTFVYTPNADYTGSDSFVVTISDGNGGSTTSNVTVAITPVNDAPVAVADSIVVGEGGVATALVGGATSILANDGDLDGDSLTAVLVDGPVNGSLILNPDGTFSYIHNGSETTTDSFTYRVDDGTVLGNIVTVNVKVNPVNDAPVAVGDIANVDQGSSVVVAVRANDTDAENDPLTVIGVSQGANGSVVIDAVTGNPIYTPNAGFSGDDSFIYTVKDSSGATAGAVVNVVVKPNDPSVLVQDIGFGTEDNDVTGNVLTNDTDADDTLSVASFEVAGLGNFSAGQTAVIAGVGSFVLNANGSYVFDPVANWNGAAPQVSYTTNTGSSSTLNISLTPVNDSPDANDDFYATQEDTPVVFDLADFLTNDIDVDGDSLVVFSAGAISNGALSLVGGKLVFTPTAEYSGPASFNYSIHDGRGKVDTATVYINVTAVNDPSTLVADNQNSPEDLDATGNVLSNDLDPDDALQVSSFILNGVSYSAGDSASLAAVGTFTLQSNGSYTFTPVANYNGPVPQVTYTTNTGISSTLNITITPVNDKPVANADYLDTMKNVPLEINLATLVANDTDIDGDTLTVFSAGSVSNGTLSYIDGKLHFIPTAGYTGPASFTYSITDGHGTVASATVYISVTAPPNQAPETNALVVSGDEDTLLTINLAGSDSDGSVAGYVIKSLPANGLLYSDAAMTTLIAVDGLVSGPVYFKPDAHWNGVSNFNYSARDNLGLDDATPAAVSITVNPSADAAILGTGTGSVKEDTPAQATATGTLTITDPDAGEAAFIAQTNSAGSYGSFSVNAAGEWTYNLDNSKPAVQALKAGETKTEQFTVASVDGTTTTVTVTVTGTNDTPVATGDTASVNQNAVLTLTPVQLLGNDVDPDGDTLSILSVQGAVNGSVTLVGGNVVFTPAPGYHGPASFTYTASDGQGGSSNGTVSVNVIKPNTAPEAVNDQGAASGSTYTGFAAEYFGYNEGTQGANLTNLQQIYSFINGRAADATFVAKTFDYGTNFTAGNNLGFGSNLQSFLGSDAASLSADPATTTDAIIRMRGFVELGAGNYNFKVLADDGYQILVDGVVVATRDLNQSAVTTTHNPFNLALGGLHAIEIVYWDQGGNARLKVELSDDAGNSYKLLSTVPNYSTSSLSAVEDTPINIAASTLLANDTDADGDTLSIISVQGAVNGTVSLVGGNIQFIPAANYAGPASFTYTVSDGKGGTDTATVNLSIAPVNDAPVAIADSGNTGMNTALSIPVSQLLTNDSDPEGNPISLVSVQGAVNGSVSVSGSNVIFTPSNNFEGVATFTYTIRDTAGATSTETVSVTVGSASAPSLVVSKSLLALARGTGGTSVKFPIITSLVDTDGSESLVVKISGVPTGLTFNSGTNLGAGVWQFVPADLPNLQMNVPGSYTTLGTNLTVQVTSTEANGGATASTSSVVSLKAAFTTVDWTTTTSGSLTTGSANDFIQGGAGNNTINGGSGNNWINGGDGNDTLSALAGSDVFFGGNGNDVISAGSGTDRIHGGTGNDSLTGGDATENFVDVFAWSLGDQGTAGSPAVDTIQNFSTAAAGSNGNGGDVLDLRDLLQGEGVGPANGAGNLANYLHFEVAGGNTIVHISHTGGFGADSHSVGGSYTTSAETQQIVLSGVNLQTLYAGATTDQQIITQLLNNNKLITD